MSKVTVQVKLGKAIRQRREALGYSQDTFADAIGMHRAYYSSIERGERNLTLSTIERVVAGLQCKLSDLTLAANI